MKIGILWDPGNPLTRVGPVVEALKEAHDVIDLTFETCGHRINPNGRFELQPILERSNIDSLMWIEGGPFPNDFQRCGCSKSAWLLNTHLEPTLLDLSSHFDIVMTTQRTLSASDGHRWVPLCAPKEIPIVPAGFHFAGADPIPPAHGLLALSLTILVPQLHPPSHPVVICPGQIGVPSPKTYSQLAAGAAVIVDAETDMRDIGNPGEHYLVVPPPHALQTFLGGLATDPQLTQRLANNAKRVVEHLHTPSIRAKQLIEHIKPSSQVLSGANYTPAVSIITTCYKYLRRFRIYLDSLARQNLPVGSLEIVVCDPGSPDGLADYLREFAHAHPYLRIIHVPIDVMYHRNRGVCINRAFEASTGKIIVSTDGDIVFRPDTISKLISTCKEHPDRALGVRRSFLDRETSHSILERQRDPFTDFDELAESKGDGEPDGKLGVLGYCQVVTREAFVKAGYPETYDKINQSDIVFLERLEQYANVTPLFLMDQTVLHLWHPRDWSGAKEFL